MPAPIQFPRDGIHQVFQQPYFLWPEWRKITVELEERRWFRTAGHPLLHSWESRFTGGGTFLRRDNLAGNWDAVRSNGCGGAEIYEHSAYIIGERPPGAGLEPDDSSPYFIGFPRQTPEYTTSDPAWDGFIPEEAARHVEIYVLPVQGSPGATVYLPPWLSVSQAAHNAQLSFYTEEDRRHYLAVRGVGPGFALHIGDWDSVGIEGFLDYTEFGDPYPGETVFNTHHQEYQNWTPVTFDLKDFPTLDVEAQTWARYRIDEYYSELVEGSSGSEIVLNPFYEEWEARLTLRLKVHETE